MKLLLPFTTKVRTSHICYGKSKNRKDDWPIHNNSNNEGYLLFQAKNIPLKGNHISLYDVRDAVECCSGILNEHMRNECYIQFGVDGKMAEKYYKHIERMERQYELPDDPIPIRHINIKKKKGLWVIFEKNEE